MGYEQPKKQAGVTSAIIQNASYTYDEDAQASDAYAITLDPAPSAYVAGQTFKFKANTANTGGATLNVNALGAKTILKNNDQALATGDIEAGSIVEVTYDGTNFQLQSVDQNLTQDEIADGSTNRSYTNTEKTKLAGIETSADVTDADNVGSVMNLATGKTTPVNADSVPITDSEASNVIKKLTFTNLKAFLKTYFDTLYNLVTIASSAEVTTGTDNAKAISPDALAGSDYGKRVVGVQVFAFDADNATGDGKAFFRVPSTMNGWNLVDVEACVYTAGTTGSLTVQIRNKTQAVDMLTTKITVDSAETDSTTATAPAIDATNDDVASGDVIAIDVDTVHTTPAKGLFVELTFQLP